MINTDPKLMALLRQLQDQLHVSIANLPKELATSFDHLKKICEEIFAIAGIQPQTDFNAVKQPATPLIKVMVIDDDQDIHRMLRYILPKQGFELNSQTDPLQALNQISSVAPKIIMLDLMMPELSGFEVLKRLDEHPQRSNFKVIVGSSRSYDTDRIEALKLGANDFVAKPYNLQELLLRLRQLS